MIEFKNIDSKLKASLKEVIQNNLAKPITPGKDYNSVTGKMIDPNDILFGVDAL